MSKIIVLLLFAASVVYAADAPTAAIQSPTQAVVRFRDACVLELKASLPAAELERITVYTDELSHHLAVQRMRPEDLNPPRGNFHPSGEKWRIYGAHAAVSDSRNDTWCLTFSTNLGELIAYLDAASGRVLYLHTLPEG